MWEKWSLSVRWSKVKEETERGFRIGFLHSSWKYSPISLADSKPIKSK
jgi:hypothetical protein